MTPRKGLTRLLAGAAAALVAGLSLTAAPAPATAATTAVTVRIDPSYQQPEFEGWGTSLVWMANATGGYPEEIRRKLVDMLYGEDGLRLNIARYNIGGGNAPTVKPYMRPGGAVPGWWKAPATYGPTDKDWWDPNNAAHWNWDADPNQRWWVDAIKSKVTRWEAFSNSPPWFQTVSGYVSGGTDPSVDQIRADKVDEFGTYLVKVTEHLEKAHGIKFSTIDPLNEPNTDYWKTTIGTDGNPTGLTIQEGAHASPALQAKVVLGLKKALTGASTKAVVSAPDETNPGKFLNDWNSYPADARAAVDQLNVHTYGTGQRTSARDLAKGEDRKLWMSEVEGNWAKDFTDMKSGLGIASRIVDDIRELEPSAWVLWQPVEDTAIQLDDGKNEGKKQWGSIHIPFDCKATDTLKTCKIQTNTKYDTLRNFTHYIRPGDHMVKVDNAQSVAAINKAGTGATVVHVNSSSSARSIKLDLSGFGAITKNATVTPVVTSASGKLVQGKAVAVSGKSATFTVPAESVTTFIVSGVSGVARDAALVQSGNRYRLQGVQSGLSLAPSTDGTGLVIHTNDPAKLDQLWTLRKMTKGVTDRERYEIINAATGKRAAVRDGNTVLESQSTSSDATEWIMSTTGDGTYTFVNVGNHQLFDVGGASTADGSKVGTWLPSSGDNQRWKVLDESQPRTEPVSAYTVPGRVPVLPTTVTAVYRGGTQASLPVTWQLPATDTWSKAGKVTVRGTATDPLGTKVDASAVVTVDTFVATVPGRAKTYVGGEPALPATVVARGKSGGQAELPVTWNAAPDGAFDKLGQVTLRGTAKVVDGSTLPATVVVQVTKAAEANVALDPAVTVSATYTEGGYNVERLRNGITAEKAWSDWKSGTQNASETISMTFPKGQDVTRVVTHTYRDGSSGTGLPKAVKVQLRNAKGECVDASADVAVGLEGAPVVDVPVKATRTTGVCVVLTPQSGGYLTLGEVQVFAKAASTSSDAALSAIQVDGAAIAGFDPKKTTYSVTVNDPAKSVVTATARDLFATVKVGATSAGLSTITVTSEDGEATATYRVALVRKSTSGSGSGSGEGGSLPVTGVALGGIIGLGVIVLGGGVALVVLSRRRRPAGRGDLSQ